MTAVRRSNRERRPATSIYEEAKKVLDEEEEVRRSLSPRKSPRKSRKSNATDDDNNDDEEDQEVPDEDEEEVDSDDDDDDGDDDDDDSEDSHEDESPKKKRKTPTEASANSAATSTATSAAGNKKKHTNKIQVQVGKSTLHKNNPTSTKTNAATKQRKKPRTQTVLATLAKKVLEEHETPDTFLLAALLQAGTNVPKLQHVCRTMVIEPHADNPNTTHVQLLNLLFRVVGGTSQSALPETLQLDDMDDAEQEWAQIITNVVDDMRYTAPDQVLLCADPLGAVHAASPTSPISQASLGIRTFYQVHSAFWYQLATVSLEDAATNRFAIDTVRDVVSRLSELIEVAQPDIRSAAVVACLEMSCAMLHQTSTLRSKMEKTSRQLKAASKEKKVSKKVESLQHTLDSLTRRCDDLEALVDANFSAVFMNRYRDSNPHIRALTISKLGTMCLVRPDLYLRDKYLKYIGWTLSDKATVVRIASLQALCAPFADSTVDSSAMQNVISKFLSRLADCTIDVDLKVQQEAMTLFLALERAQFLEDLDDDSLWEQVNNRALASDASPQVRRDALYFIIDQLEAFDNDDDGDTASTKSKKWSKDKSASLAQSSDKAAAKKLSTLAGWVSHTLTDGGIPADKIRLELTDYIVDSLRAMPEHASLVTINWSAMVRAIYEAEDDVVQQRILVRMLARAAQSQVATVAAEFLHEGVDPALAELEVADHKALEEMTASKKGSAASTKASTAANQHEIMSVALLKALPDLLVKFKADTFLLTSISSLPRLLKPSVLSLPSHKTHILSLVETLIELYQHANATEAVLQNLAAALIFLSQGEHVRAPDAQRQLSQLVTDLSERLVTLMLDEEEPEELKKKTKKGRSPKGKAKKDEDNEDNDQTVNPQNKEFTICVCLRRLRVLAKRMDLAQVLEEDLMDKLRGAILDGMSSRLEARQIVLKESGDNDDEIDGDGVAIPELWKHENGAKLHEAFADAVKDSLHFLLASLAWSFLEAKEKDPIASADVNDVEYDELMEDQDIDSEDHPIVQQRDQLMDFICLCFEQYLPAAEDELYTEEHINFSSMVQTAACQTASDLRSLFPKEWVEAASPLLRVCALTSDKLLIGGCVRFFRSEEATLRNVEDQEFEDIGHVCDLLLPFCRHFAANWSKSNRREAGFVLAHIVGSGQASQQMLTALSRMVKKMDPVHLLETHMACLVSSFDDWLNSEPEELESDRPTDEEMATYDASEKEHKERFDLMVQQACRLSQSLGVGKLDPQLQNPLLGFCREGIRYGFSTDLPGGEEPLLPGGRLTFLSLLSKYVTWIRRNKSFQDVVVQNVIEREDDLRADADFEDAHEDDLAALTAFRKTIGIKIATALTPKSPRSVYSQDIISEDEEEEESRGTGKNNSSNKPARLSRGSSMGSSIRSGVTHTLSPLMEEDNNDDEDASSMREVKRRKLSQVRRSSVGSAMTMGTQDKVNNETIEEEEGSYGSSESD